LYIVHSIPEDSKFVPKTRKEISKIEWIPITQLPASFSTKETQTSPTRNPNHFWMVIPFVNKIKKWIQVNRKQIEKKRKHSLNKPIFVPVHTTDKSEQPTKSTVGITPIPPLLDKLSTAIDDYQLNHEKTEDLPSRIQSTPLKVSSPQGVSKSQVQRQLAFGLETTPTVQRPSRTNHPWLNFKFDKAAIMQPFVALTDS